MLRLFCLAIFLFPIFSYGSDSSRLDELFDSLRAERNSLSASRISEQIWQEWHLSGDATVDLLSGWARDAVDRLEYSAALDLLDQVIIMSPDYAEGWNQRATVHYLRQDYGKSIADIERVLSLEPRHFGALAGLGTIQQILGQDEQALETWYRTLSIYPAMRNAQDAVILLEESLEKESNSL